MSKRILIVLSEWAYGGEALVEQGLRHWGHHTDQD